MGTPDILLGTVKVREMVRKEHFFIGLVFGNFSDKFFYIPPDLVVNQLPFDGESSSNLDFICLRDVSTTFCPLMSGKIRPIISIPCDFTTKSGGI
jgi:hypothetical protein